jgi:hypothetical protein
MILTGEDHTILPGCVEVEWSYFFFHFEESEHLSYPGLSSIIQTKTGTYVYFELSVETTFQSWRAQAAYQIMTAWYIVVY